MADTDPINWLLLVELLVVVIVASAFLFYWNRLVASIFAFFVRLVTWRYYNAYISIGSLPSRRPDLVSGHRISLEQPLVPGPTRSSDVPVLVVESPSRGRFAEQ
jgi:hypothetical protein